DHRVAADRAGAGGGRNLGRVGRFAGAVRRPDDVEVRGVAGETGIAEGARGGGADGAVRTAAGGRAEDVVRRGARRGGPGDVDLRGADRGHGDSRRHGRRRAGARAGGGDERRAGAVARQRATGETLGDAGLAREVGAVADLRHLPQVVAADRSAAAGGRGGVDVDRVGAAGAFIPVVSEDAKHLTAEHVEAVVVAPLETVLDVRRGGAGRPHRGGPGVSAIGRFAVVDGDAGARGV